MGKAWDLPRIFLHESPCQLLELWVLIHNRNSMKLKFRELFVGWQLAGAEHVECLLLWAFKIILSSDITTI